MLVYSGAGRTYRTSTRIT
ncbi:hypothetical protein F383_26029 [Gossypium arboreum]|uniref:Uncharacterized protein n=1 Tax=Gossypium arboreum TaxID=29729 RepID=A0A0B0MND4_GOSAR|nr:hypothetical protein F383_26029 [Gossypium arboreum]